MCDPNEPPLPPHVTWDQAKSIPKSRLKGDPDAGAVVRQPLERKIEEFLPR